MKLSIYRWMAVALMIGGLILSFQNRAGVILLLLGVLFLFLDSLVKDGKKEIQKLTPEQIADTLAYSCIAGEFKGYMTKKDFIKGAGTYYDWAKAHKKIKSK